jgi:DNA invertase Pin-like site-specific DNA recombinase
VRANTETQTAATYERISFDRVGDGHGVASQAGANAAYCASHGLAVASQHRYSDNDISASNGRHRPGYEAMMAAAARREFGVIVVFHTSRLWRSRVERAKAIEVLRKAGVSVLAVKGPSLDMSTAYGRGLAGLLGEFDTMEGEVKSERQRLGNETRARAGKRPATSRRPFGYQPGGLVTEPAEADAIRWAADALLGGASLSAVTREWERRGLVTAQTGRPFTRQSITTILRNPRIAGLACQPGRDGARFGEITGRGGWEPVLEEGTWRSVEALLADPARKPPRGVRTLLGGLASCACGNPVIGAANHLGQRVYRCNAFTRGDRPGPHVQVRAEPVTEYVEMAVVAFLRDKKTVARIVTPRQPGRREAELRKEAARIQKRLDAMAGDWMLGGEDDEVARSMMRAAADRGRGRLAEISAELAGMRRGHVLSRFLTGDALRVWDSLDLSVQREVIRAITTITLLPAGRGARSYDPAEKIVMPGIPAAA